MRGYHRIIGDPPRRGFGNDIVTIGFPGSNWAASAGERRLPLVGGIPFFEPQSASEGGVRETQSAYELQSLDFWRVAAVYSAEGIVAGIGRPHGYSDIVALTGDDESKTEACGTPEDWLQFSKFMSLDTFWALDASVDSIPAETWTPGDAPIPEWKAEKPLPQGFVQALAMRYWRSASQRAFDGYDAVTPVRICIGNEKVGSNIIPLAKSFFKTYILPALPKATWHIVSMSAPAPVKQLQKYKPTALAFLYPENTLGGQDENLFDLRTDFFVPLSEEELAFAEMTMRGETVKTLSELFNKSAQLYNRAAMEDTPFMADYDIAWSLYQLEKGTHTGEEMLALWYKVYGLLVSRHGFTSAQVDALLADLEPMWLSKLGNSEIAMNDATYRFFLNKALHTPSGALAEGICNVLVKHQQARNMPFFATVVDEKLLADASAERISAVFGSLLGNAWLANPIEQEQLDVLSSQQFEKLCNENESLKSTLVGYLTAFGKEHGELALFIMPLAQKYLDKSEVLHLSLNQLLAEYTKQLPDGAVCERISNAAVDMDEEGHGLLARYLVEAFCNHIDDVEALCKTWLAMKEDASDGLCGIFGLDQTQPQRVSQPISSVQLTKLMDGLYAVTGKKQQVHDALSAYARRVLDAAAVQRNCMLGWYAELDPNSRYIQPRERCDTGIAHFADAYIAMGAEPSNDDFRCMLGWMSKDKSAEPKGYEQKLKSLYNPLCEQGRAIAQIDALWGCFTSVQEDCALRTHYLQCIRAQVAKEWESNQFFDPVDKRKGDCAKLDISFDGLMDETLKSKSDDILKKRFGAYTQTAQFSKAFEHVQKRANDAYKSQWLNVLSLCAKQKCSDLLKSTGTFEDILNANQLFKKMGIENADSDMLCATAYIKAYSFITRELPEAEDVDVAQKTATCIGEISRYGNTQISAYVRHLLFNAIHDLRERLPIRKRMAAALISAGPPDEGFQSKNALSVLAWNNGREKPFSDDGLLLFSQIGAFFRFAQAVDPAYPDLLRAGLENDYRSYVATVRASKKEAISFIPWLENAQILDAVRPTQAFINWLRG